MSAETGILHEGRLVGNDVNLSLASIPAKNKRIAIMRIQHLLQGYSDALGQSRRSEPQTAASPVKTQPPDPGSSAARIGAVGKIVAQYDVAKITPAELSELAQKLFDGGAISASELQELLAMQADLEDAGYRADDRIDLVEFYRERVDRIDRKVAANGSPAEKQALTAELKKLDWAEKLAMAHRYPESIGLNTAA